MFCCTCTLLYVHSSIAIILVGRESWLLCLICLPGDSWWLSDSSLLCHGVVCGLRLWYLLIILTIFEKNGWSAFWHHSGLVSWVRCGTWLYWFLIFAPLLTLQQDMTTKVSEIDISKMGYVSYYKTLNRARQPGQIGCHHQNHLWQVPTNGEAQCHSRV